MGLMKRRSEQKKTSFKSEESEEEKKIKEIECVARRCRDEIEIGMLTVFTLSTFFSLFFYVVDLCFDICWLITFYVRGDYWYFRCTLAFLVIPAVITIVKCLFIYNNGSIIPNENIYDPRELLPKEEYSDFNWPAIKWALGFICPIPRYVLPNLVELCENIRESFFV